MEQLRSTKLKRFLKANKTRKADIVIILENIQYARNVAEMFRIADALGIGTMYLTGISHQPPFGKDLKKVSRSKETKVNWIRKEHTGEVITELRKKGYRIAALEITDESKNLYTYQPTGKIAIIVGNESYGVIQTTLDKCDEAIFIPMLGKGASMNVSVSAAIALSHLTAKYATIVSD